MALSRRKEQPRDETQVEQQAPAPSLLPHALRARIDADLAALETERTNAGLRPKPDVAAELERLSALHAAGSLSDEEFAAAKARLLG